VRPHGAPAGSPRAAIAILLTFVLSAVVFVAAFLAIVRVVDARNHFGTGIFPVVTLDGRAEKLALFRAYAAAGPVQGLVVGSSRSWALDPAVLSAVSGRRFFNFSVGNARVEDYLAIYRWVRGQGVRLEVLIIGLDLEALHDDDQRESTLEFNDELRRGLDGRAASSGPAAILRVARRYKRAFGISQVGEIVTVVGISAGWKNAENATRYEADGHLRRLTVKSRDGVGPRDWLRHCTSEYLRRIGRMSQLSAMRRATLARLIEEARADGVAVKVWLTPVDPAALHEIAPRSRYGQLLDDLRAYLDDLQHRVAFETYDFTDPSTFDGTPASWEDCFHVDASNAARVAARLMARRS
jgi:hypothetical protein